MTPRRLLALTTLLVCGPAIAAQVPGRTEASYSVSFNGESNYSVPLWTPPGIKGIQPSLALVYSSNGGAGHFGAGWSLSGLTSIHRCQKTWIQDGIDRDVRNDSSDRFCLDGNQLKLVTGTYGAAGSTYQTEIETFSRITAYSAAGNGPAYFIVEGKDGLYYEYGRTPDSMIESLGQTTARVWLINKVSDRNDNAMLISYTEDATNGSFRVASIQYTQNITAGVSADYAVEFVYQSVPVAEVDSQYLAGSKVKRVMRADRIDVKAAGSVVRRYELTYEASLSTTSKSRLASIQECGVAVTNCFAPTNFTYQNGVSGLSTETSTGQSIPANVYPWPLDVNGDGRQDLVFPSSAVSGSGTWMVMFASSGGGYTTPATNTGITNTNWSGAIPIDYNADGREDLLVPGTAGTWSVLTSNGTGFTGPANTGAAVVGTGTGLNARALDIDGDGYEDLVWAELIGYAGGDTIRWRRRDPAANFEATVGTLVGPMAVDKMIMSGVFAPDGQSRRLRAPDFNGDGRGDIAYQTTRRVFNEVSGTYQFFRHVSVYCAGGTEFFAAVTAPTTPEFGDFNGDGRTDLLYTTGSPAYFFTLQYSTGTSFTSVITGPSATTYGPQRFIIMDWDSDGQDDLVAPNPTTSLWDLIRSTGEGLATTSSTGVSSSVSATTVTDVNGDGLMDLGYVVSGTWRYRLHAGPQPDLLLTATDGFGLQTSFSYVPITQNNYSPTTGAVFPDQEYTGPQYVVSTMTAPTGIQSPSSFTTNYWYYGARKHLQGRSFLGFKTRRTIDTRNQLRVYESASQTFPYVGMQNEVVVKKPNDITEILHLTHTLSAQTFGTAFQTRKNPYVSASAVDRYEVDGARDGAWVAHETMSIGSIDSYGTPTSITTTAKDKDALSPWLDETYTQVVTNTTTNDTVNWCLGQVTQTTVQSTLPDATSKTRTRGAAFDAIECRPTQTSIEPGSSTLEVITNYGFDAFGNVNSLSAIGRTPAGATMTARTTTLNYGTRGQFPEKVTNALSQDTIFTYRYDLGLRASLKDPNLLIMSWLYDDFGRRTRETRVDNTYTGWDYTQCNSGNTYCGVGANDLRLQVTQTKYKTDTSVVRADQVYLDGFYRSRYTALKNLATPSSYTYTSRVYDSLGRVTRQDVPYSTVANGSRRFTYDLIDRVTADSMYTAAGTLDRQTTLTYLARYIEIKDPKLNVRNRYVDVRGLERRVTDPSPGGTFNFAFDHFGNLVSATDPASNAQTWSYNLLGILTASSDPDRGSWTYTSNSLGEPVTQTDAKSQTVTFDPFDPLGRPTKRTEAEGMSTWTWGALADNTPTAKYVGRLRSLAGPGYSETYTYDSLGRPSHTSFSADTGYGVDYAYDPISGLLDNVTYPASTGPTPLRAQYSYQYGMLKDVHDYNTPATVWWELTAIDDRFNPIEERLGNGVRILSNMDPLTGLLNWRTSGTNASSYNNQQNLSFAWDVNGNLKDRVDVNQSNLTEHFEYDALDRLDYSTLNGSTNLDVTLDAIGNITNRSDVGAYTYHATKKHAVATAGPWSFTYDNNGSMLTGRGATLTWTSYNLPASITNGSVSSQFSYTPTRAYWRQIAQYASGPETTIYIGGLFEKVTRAATDYRHMIRAGSATIVVTRSTGSNNQTYYVTQDPLGSSSFVTNSAGAMVVNESFAAYGNRRGSNWTGAPSAGDLTAIGNSTRRGFTEHTMLDNLALVHMNGRVYDPVIGRFMSADPFVDPGLGTQGLNRYSYVGNNPLSFIDPSGYSMWGTIKSWIDGVVGAMRAFLRGVGFVHDFGMGNNGGSAADQSSASGSSGRSCEGCISGGSGGGLIVPGMGGPSGASDVSDAGHGGTEGRKPVKPQIIPAAGVQCDMTPCRTVAGAQDTSSALRAAGQYLFGALDSVLQDYYELQPLNPSAGIDFSAADMLGPYQSPFPAAAANGEQFARDLGPTATVLAVVLTGRPTGVGAYRLVGGHHIHAKRAFQGIAGYDLREALAVSDEFLARYGVRHADITAAQQRLFRQLAASGAPNTLTQHSRIAYRALVDAGIPRSVAADLVIGSQSQLIRSGIFEPSAIPWGGQ